MYLRKQCSYWLYLLLLDGLICIADETALCLDVVNEGADFTDPRVDHFFFFKLWDFIKIKRSGEFKFRWADELEVLRVLDDARFLDVRVRDDFGGLICRHDEDFRAVSGPNERSEIFFA